MREASTHEVFGGRGLVEMWTGWEESSRDHVFVVFRVGLKVSSSANTIFPLLHAGIMLKAFFATH